MLSDVNARQLYDRYGPEGMRRHSGAAAGTGNARRAWDEFKVTIALSTQLTPSLWFWQIACKLVVLCQVSQLARSKPTERELTPH